jgi:ABC-type glycerol-3-phosphate transport system substrate-binding protein
VKVLIIVVFAALSALSAIAVLTRPADSFPGRLHLVRTTDPNPRRTMEVAAFNARYPDLALILDNGSNRLEKIIVQSSSGVGPDLFDVGNGSQLQTYVNSGIALDVTEEAKQMGFSAMTETWPAVRGELMENGRQYSYPANVNTNILIYNKAVFDKVGVPYPKQNLTWEQFFDVAKKVTKRAGAQTIYGSTGINWQAFFLSLKGEYFSPDGTRLLLTQKPMLTAFQMHHDMLYKHRITPSSLELKSMSGQGGWGSGAINQFSDGRFAMIAIGKWALITFRSAHKDQTEKFDKWQKRSPRDEKARPSVMRLGSVMLPHMAGKPLVFGVASRSEAVNALGKHREQALKFLQFLASKEYSQLVNDGVDALPGNPKYASVGLKPGDPDLSEMEMHRNTIETMKFGYQTRHSPFLLQSDVERILSEQMSRIETDPSLPVAEALNAAQDDLERLMQRNLDRDPKLKARYKELTGSEQVVEAQAAGAQP